MTIDLITDTDPLVAIVWIWIGIFYFLVGMLLCSWAEESYTDSITAIFGHYTSTVLFAMLIWPVSVPLALLNHALVRRWK